MELTSSQLLPVGQEQAWQALNDPDVLKACIPGCDAMERVSPEEFAIGMAVAVGPVKAKFKGRLQLADVVAPQSYTLRFDGQGGPAGFGKGEAKVALAAEGEQATRLSYAVKAQVGGKIAQVGSRLIDGAARKVADDFFAAFNAELTRRYAPAPVAAGSAEAQAGAPGAAQAPAQERPRGALAWWIAGAVLLLLALLWWLR